MGDVTYYVQRFYDHQLYNVILHGSRFSVTVTADAYIAIQWARDVTRRYMTYLRSGKAAGTWSAVHIAVMCARALPRLPTLTCRKRAVYPASVPHDTRNHLVGFSNRLDLTRFMDPEVAYGTLETMVQLFLGYTMSWTVEMLSSDWGAESLSHQQVLAASTQARCAFLIAK